MILMRFGMREGEFFMFSSTLFENFLIVVIDLRVIHNVQIILSPQAERLIRD